MLRESGNLMKDLQGREVQVNLIFCVSMCVTK